MGSLDGDGFLVKPEIAETRYSKERTEAEEKKAVYAGNPTTPYISTGSDSTETTSNEEKSKSVSIQDSLVMWKQIRIDSSVPQTILRKKY